MVDQTSTSGDVEPAPPAVDAAPKLDVGQDEGAELCPAPRFMPCDDSPNATWFEAMGMSCGDLEGLTFSEPTQLGTTMVFEGRLGGAQSPFSPREGERMVLMSTGFVGDIELTPDELAAYYPDFCADDPLVCPSSGLEIEPRVTLPPPIRPRRVASDRDCNADPTLVGNGDCSNTLAEQWARGMGAYDYSELRMRAKVPDQADAFAFDFAFFSSEYPVFTDRREDSPFNDMFIVWLESEAWTGNITFDEQQQPITVQSVLLDYRSPSESCPECEAPELAGFAMENHASTRWLRTRASVRPGETIELVFALFDMTDANFDTAVLLDNFEWTCSDGRPVTWAG